MKRSETILGAVIIAALVIGGALYFRAGKIQQSSGTTSSSESLLTKPGEKAPEITSPAGFVNTNEKPITIGEFKGKKVVLVDMWTYSCINCQRTLPYIKAWYDAYHDQGLEIIGIHTPEFSFEKVQKNVEDAVAKAGIKYPVVLDNDYGTWNAFKNEFWPHKYLIDINGNIVYDHTGEGGYDLTEQAIRQALEERRAVLGLAASTTMATSTMPVDATPLLVGSPETYFGAARNQYLGNGKQSVVGMQNLTIPASIDVNTLYLAGQWNFSAESAVNSGPAKIIYKYQAKSLYFVGDGKNPVRIKVLVDGKVPGELHGMDIDTQGNGTITDSRLYKLVEGSAYGEHTIEIQILDGNLEAFTFTFG